MAKRDRKCYLCGTSYKYCSTCSQDRMKPAYMSEFHSEDCVRIFDICTRYNMGLMSKHDAQEALNKCDLSNKDNFKDYVQRDLVNIFAEDEKQDAIEDSAVEEVAVKKNTWSSYKKNK